MIGATSPEPTWHPIASIPTDRRDRPEVPLWAGRLVLGTWCDGWCDPVGRPIAGVTHYAEIEGPPEMVPLAEAIEDVERAKERVVTQLREECMKMAGVVL